jgi:uncharacterized SAM-binding protein YcdF (DUF218 family)
MARSRPRMYAFLSKLLEPFTLAMMALVLLLCTSPRRLVLTWRGAATGAALLAVVASSWPPVAWVAMRGLEVSRPDRTHEAGADDPLVVLGGGVRRQPDGSWDLADDSMVRTIHGARLYHALGPRLVVVSGGSPTGQPGTAVAGAMRNLLRQLGVPDDHILVDDRSRTTFENATETARLLEPFAARRIVLVTQAHHLARSVRVFERRGFDVLPAGCDYVASRLEWGVTDLLPDGRSARRTSLAAHEYLGLLYYRLSGQL